GGGGGGGYGPGGGCRRLRASWRDGRRARGSPRRASSRARAQTPAARPSGRVRFRNSATWSPPPLAGEGQGGGMRYGRVFPLTPSPPLPRKREREQTEPVGRADAVSLKRPDDHRNDHEAVLLAFPPLPLPARRRFSSAANTRSGVTGNSLKRTPMASAMALVSAGRNAASEPSPASLAPNGPCGSLLSTMPTSI